MKKTLTTILLFAGMASAWASGLPEGPYKASCQDIKMVGTSLQATCLGYGYRHGTPITTRLDNANTCAAVENRGGQLHCLRQK